MKIRLTDIDLRFNGQVFPIGSEPVVGEDIPVELAQRRLDAKTAVLVVDGEAVSPELALAIAALDTHGRGLAAASLALLVFGEAGSDDDVIAIARAFEAQFEVMTSQLDYDVDSRMGALRRRADLALHPVIAPPIEGGEGPAAPPASASEPPVPADQHAAANTAPAPPLKPPKAPKAAT